MRGVLRGPCQGGAVQGRESSGRGGWSRPVGGSTRWQGHGGRDLDRDLCPAHCHLVPFCSHFRTEWLQCASMCSCPAAGTPRPGGLPQVSCPPWAFRAWSCRLPRWARFPCSTLPPCPGRSPLPPARSQVRGLCISGCPAWDPRLTSSSAPQTWLTPSRPRSPPQTRSSSVHARSA